MSNKSVGTKLQIGITAVAGLTSIDAPEKSAETLDTTTLDNASGYRTFTGGFKDGGEVTVSGYFEVGDAGQTAMDTAFESGAVTPFLIIFPLPITAGWSFNGVVTKFKAGSAELDGLLGFEATIKVSGKPSLTTTASAGLSALAVTGTGGTLSPTFSAGTRSYAFSGVTGTNVTVTATAASHTLMLFVDGVYSQDLTTAVASSAVPLTLNVGKKLTIIAAEAGKAPVAYEIIAVKTS